LNESGCRGELPPRHRWTANTLEKWDPYRESPCSRTGRNQHVDVEPLLRRVGNWSSRTTEALLTGSVRLRDEHEFPALSGRRAGRILRHRCIFRIGTPRDLRPVHGEVDTNAGGNVMQNKIEVLGVPRTKCSEC